MSIPFSVVVSLALIFTTIGLVTGRGLPFGAIAAAQGAAMMLGILYTGTTIRYRKKRHR